MKALGRTITLEETYHLQLGIDKTTTDLRFKVGNVCWFNIGSRYDDPLLFKLTDIVESFERGVGNEDP